MISRPFSGYTYPVSKRPRYVRAKLRDPLVFNVSLTQTVIVSQIVSALGKEVLVSILHDLTAGQILKPNRVLKRSITHSVTATSIPLNLATNVSHNVSVTHVIKLLRSLQKRVTSSVQTQQVIFIRSPRFIPVNQTIFITDFTTLRIPTVRLSVAHNLTAAHNVSGRNSTYHLNVTDTIAPVQTIKAIGAAVKISLAQNVNASHAINLAYSKQIQHDVVVKHIINRKRQVNKTITTPLTLTSTFTKHLDYTINTNLNLISNLNRLIIVTRDFQNFETFTSFFSPSLYIVTKGPHPVVSGVDIVYGYLTLLESAKSSIVLPVPELNDSQRNSGTIDLKKTMDGAFKGYIKTSQVSQLNYTWLLDYDKAREFKEWMKVNMSLKIRLTNWKGEIWYGDIVNDSFELTAETKYAGNARQKTSCTLQFEGVKVNG